jgi:hypothetical protein
MSEPTHELLKEGPVVINIGVVDFGESISEQGVEVVHVDWKPPVDRDEELDRLLDELL